MAAPILSVVGLVLIGLVTISLLNGQVPFVGGKTGSNGNGNGNGNGDGNTQRTPAPSNVVIVPPTEVSFKGSIVYAKAGNIWVQTGKDVRQLTNSGGDSMPSWSSDGQWIYYIRTRDGEGRWPVRGSTTTYVLQIPDLMRVPADGSAEPERLATGRFKQGSFTWSYWMRQPVISPDGTTIAMVSDAPNPEDSNVVLQFFDTTTKKIKRAGVAETGLLGHQDPGVAPRRQVPAVREERPVRDARHAGHRPVRPGDQEDQGHHDVGLPEPVLFAGRAVHRRHQDLEPGDGRRDPRRLERPRAAPGH